MKILAIDDQQLILLSIQKKLTESGFDVCISETGDKGIVLYEQFKPDLVIVDINMPGMSGLDVVKHIRLNKGDDTPILILSGNTDEQVIVDGFDLGINDYMKKPVSLNEMAARVDRILGIRNLPERRIPVKTNQILQQYCVGIVIPCYNEEERLSSAAFQQIATENLGYHLCFVNDGSTDNTLEVLNRLKEGNEDRISVYNCEENGGKAEAVRQGMQHLAKDKQFDYLGYLDADLSTDFRDFDELVRTLENSEFKIVSGSRISRMGANITKESARKIISKTINMIIQKILEMPFKDTQCGAKIMSRDIVEPIFEDKFITRWLFDVEIFMRMKGLYGKDKAHKLICEQPLKRWIHADGSKLSMKDSVKIIGQLGHIAMYYNRI
ncbi:response regulator [Muriicola sp.]|uniref:response regulator n=2 Tax=Muriicola sp. TaxID=2020856 RepID=UPI003563613B